MILTTTHGECRSCKMVWATPRTRISPKDLRRDPISGAAFFPKLPRCCPRCGSVQIAYPYNQKLAAHKRVDAT